MSLAMLAPLYDEEVDNDLPLGLLAAVEALPAEPLAEDDPLRETFATEIASRSAEVELRHVRAMLVRTRQLERELGQLGEARRAVMDSYDHTMGRKQAEIDKLKAAMQSVLMNGKHGTKLTFPDAGRINLSTAGGNLALASKEEAVTAHGEQFKREVVDEAAMNQWAREQYRETGQAPAGYAVQPKRKTLVVAKA
jgi:homogentisate 1,2-dioxygenase